MGEPNDQLMEKMKEYTKTKFSKTRADVEREIQERWSVAEAKPKPKPAPVSKPVSQPKAEVASEPIPEPAPNPIPETKPTPTPTPKPNPTPEPTLQPKPIPETPEIKPAQPQAFAIWAILVTFGESFMITGLFVACLTAFVTSDAP